LNNHNWDEIYAHAKLQAQIKTVICLDECITNARQAATAIEPEACRIINIKPGRVSRHTEAQKGSRGLPRKLHPRLVWRYA